MLRLRFSEPSGRVREAGDDNDNDPSLVFCCRRQRPSGEMPEQQQGKKGSLQFAAAAREGSTEISRLEG